MPLTAELSGFINQTVARFGLDAQSAQLFRQAYESGTLRTVFDAQSSLSAHVDGAQAVFWNGETNARVAADYASSHNAYTLADTARGQYLASSEVANAFHQAVVEQNALREASGLPRLTKPQEYALSEPIWRSASTATASEAVGNARFFTNGAPDSIVATVELPTFLNNEHGGAAEGVSRSTLSSLSPAEQLSRMATESSTFLHDSAGYDPVTHKFTFDGSGTPYSELSRGPTLPAELTGRLGAADFSSTPHGTTYDLTRVAGPAGEVAGFIEGTGRVLGALGVAAMAADGILSTARALGQVSAGDYQGALTTEGALAGRLTLGLLGAEVGAEFGATAGFLIGGPIGAAAGGLLGGVLGGLAGVVGGDALGGALAGALGDLLGGLGLPGFGLPGAPWNLGDPLHPPPHDPLVIDLGGDGFNLISVAQSAVHMDFGGDGFAERVGWVAPNDAFVVIDRNGDGVISLPADLIGDDTVEGFDALSAMDANHDGKIDAQDPSWVNLRLWRDLDSDGVVDAGELTTLAQDGIASLSLTKTASGQVVAGNQIAFTASATKTDGSQVNVGSALFAVDTLTSKWTPPAGFTVSDAAKALPELTGYGVVKDLASAMTLDDGLRQQVAALVTGHATQTYAQFKAAFEAVLLDWAGADSVDPASRGGYVDARHLAVLEAFYGTGYAEQTTRSSPVQHNPSAARAAGVEASYQNLLNVSFLQFAGQAPAAYAALTGDGTGLAADPYSALGPLAGEGISSAAHFDATLLLLKSFAPAGSAGVGYLAKGAAALRGAAVSVFHGDSAAYAAEVRAVLNPGAFADLVIDAGAKAQLVGGGGDETLTGTTAADMLWGAAGADSLAGGAGSDTYVWARGDGADVITESTNAGSADKLILAGVNPADVALVRSGNDVTLTIAPSSVGGSDGGSVKLVASLNEYFDQGVEQIVFADGTTWGRGDLRLKLLAQASTAGADTIVGFNTNDTITGGAGADSLSGADGSDTYVWARGAGADVIAESTNAGAADKLVLTGVNPADVSLTRAGNDVTLNIAPSTPGGSDGGSVKLLAGLNDYFDQGVEQIVFGDGTTWGRGDLRLKLLAQASTSGADTIVGFNTNDTITGGAGNDSLSGSDGSDSYIWARGAGADTISESTNAGAADKLILTGVNPADVSLTRAGNDVTLNIAPSTPGGGDGGSVKLLAGLSDYFDQGVEQIVFGDGTTWSRLDMRVKLLAQASTAGADTIVGFLNNDTIKGGAGNDSLSGGDGSDSYVWARGDGADVIAESTNAGAGDKLILTGVNPADVSLVRSGNDVTLNIAPSTAGGGDGGSVKLLASLDDYFDQGIDQIVFADGTVWTRATLRTLLTVQGTTGADTLTGTNAGEALDAGAGNDSVSALGGADTITGGAGNDSLSGGDGSDSYLWARGDGADVITESTNAGAADRLVLTGVNPADVSLARSGNDVTLNIAPSTVGGSDGGAVKLVAGLNDYFDQGVEQIVFADGTTWSRGDLRLKLLAQASTSGADTITGFNTSDTITGGAGNDSLSGGDASDSYVWARGDGADVIAESTNAGAADKLILTSVNPADVSLTRAGNDVTLNIAPSTVGGSDGGSVKLVANLNDYFDQGVEQIVFGDGTTWGRGDLRLKLLAQASTSGADTIVGFNTNDTITGGAGNDSLSGSDGSDIYVWARGDGADVIAESTNAGAADKLILTGVNPADVSLARAGNDVTLNIAPSTAGGSDGGSVKLVANLNDYFDQGVDQVVFGDGSTWSRGDLRLKLLAQASTSGADTITGFLNNDTITGGAGNDSLSGGDGSDSYVWARGDGADVIAESTNAGAADKLILTGVNPADVSLTRSGADVTLTIAPSTVGRSDGGSVKLLANLEDYFDQGVDQIAFADGSSWSRADLRAKLLAQASTSGADTIAGFNANDTIAGGAGADSLSGGSGNDVLVGGDGADTLTGGTGADVFRFDALSHSQTSTPDIITDFAAGSDRIDLSALDANSGVAGDQAFTWLGTASFSNVAGQLRYEAAPAGSRTVYGDVDGDGTADFAIRLTGTGTIQAADFLL